MKARRKIVLSAYSLVSVVAALICDGCGPSPGLSSITPKVGDQATDVAVTISGANFSGSNDTRRPVILIDGGQNHGVTTTYDSKPDPFTGRYDPYTDTTIDLTLHIDAAATAGAHTIVVETVEKGLVDSGLPYFSPGQTFYVHCTGCPQPPELWQLITQPEHTQLRSGGRVTFRFIGKNFANNNPQVQIDGDGVTPDPAPPMVQQSGDLDYFDLQITAASYATTDLHNVTVTTTGGISNALQLTVDASVPPPPPAPGGTPFLQKITPNRVVKADCFVCNGWVQFKCEGAGFGNTPEVIIDNPSLFPVTIWRDHTDQDKVAVAIMVLPSGFSEPYVSVRVRNNNTLSDPKPLYIDTRGEAQPFVLGVFDGIPRGQEGDFTVYGRNLEGAIAQPSSGIAGVELSQIQSDYDHISFHVKVDPTAPVTGDDATNLTIMTAAGETNPFSFLIYR